MERSWCYLNLCCAALGFSALALYLLNRPLLAVLSAEDGIAENATAALFLAASGLFVWASGRCRGRNIWYWGLALMCFMVAGEEISWGQRLLGVASPAPIAAINVQGEINLHNLKGIHGNVRAIGLLVIVSMCFVLPALHATVPRVRRRCRSAGMPIFPFAAAPVVVVAILFMVVPRLAGSVIFALDEVGELFVSVAFFAFGISGVAQVPGLAGLAALDAGAPSAVPRQAPGPKLREWWRRLLWRRLEGAGIGRHVHALGEVCPRCGHRVAIERPAP